LWFWGFSCFVLSSFSLSQSQLLDFGEKSRWVHFTTSSGLPSGEIISIFESSDSTLWVSTLTGIAWYDGFRWRKGDETSGWPIDKGISIRGEYQGKILINVLGAYWLGDTSGFREIIKRVRDSLVFVGQDSIRLVEKAVIFALFADSIQSRLNSKFVDKITGLYPTSVGNLWLTLTDGLYYWDGKRWTAKLLSPISLPSIGVSMVAENHDGSGICLVRTPAEEMGMWEWTRNGKPFRSELEKNVFYMVSADIDENNNVVAVAQNGEVFLRHEGKWRILPFFPENAKDITKVLFRRNGDLCVGSENGIYIWRKSFHRWTSLPQSPFELKNYVNEILTTRSGDLWIGSANGATVRHANGTTEEIAVINGQRVLNITGLQEDEESNIWISSGSSFDGTYEWNGKSWTHHQITHYSNGINVHKIRKDREGRLWFLGLGHNIATIDDDEAGAFVLDRGEFVRWGLREGLPSGRVYAFDEGKNATLWFGTHKGISRFRAGNWTHWSTSNGLRHDHAFCLATDTEGGIWFGHMSSAGLGYIDRQDSVHYFTMEDGLPDNRIYDIKVDSADVVWITSQGGLCSFDHGQWSTFDERSGLVSNSLWPVLPLKHRVYVGTLGKGVAMLDRERGKAPPPIVLIHRPIVENQDAFVRWESFTYYGEVTPENSFTRYRINDNKWSAWNTQHEISLRQLNAGSYKISVQGRGLYGQYNTIPEEATFTILPPLYLRPIIYIPASGAIIALVTLLTMLQLRRIKHREDLEKSEERYRLITELMSDYAYLLRIEDDGKISVLWITESFTRLTGYSIEEFKRPDFIETYNFPEDLSRIVNMYEGVKKGKPESCEGRVVTRNGDLLWIHNHVAPIWDRARTRVTHMYGIARDITRRKNDEEQMRVLATELSLTEERERRRMATFLHDTIGQTLAFSKIKLRTLEKSMADENTLNSLLEIRKLVEESISNTRSLTFELSPPALHELGVAEAIRSLAEQLFEQHNIGLQFTEEALPHRPNNDLSVVLYYAVREVFINIIKHSRADKVSVSICSPNGSIQVAVHDNGIGITKTPEGDIRKRKDSFGLFNIRERIMHFGGNVDVSSTPDKGTTVIITVPVDPSIPERKENQ
jgi:PAS domain S-box-containing protein